MENEKIILGGDLRGQSQRSGIGKIVEEHSDSGTTHLSVDISGVTAVDYDALIEFLAVRNRCAQDGIRLEITEIPPGIRGIIKIFRIPLN